MTDGPLSNGCLTGSCLCGAVAYEITPPVDDFVHCYCRRCRKATGTARASNLLIQPDRFRWTKGEKHLRRYDLPEARSFSTISCEVCNAPLPHATRSGKLVIVPAGSLDQEPPISPRAHMHWDSRAAWCRVDESDIPTFGEWG